MEIVGRGMAVSPSNAGVAITSPKPRNTANPSVSRRYIASSSDLGMAATAPDGRGK